MGRTTVRPPGAPAASVAAAGTAAQAATEEAAASAEVSRPTFDPRLGSFPSASHCFSSGSVNPTNRGRVSPAGGFGGNFYGNDGYGGNYSHSGSVDWWGN